MEIQSSRNRTVFLSIICIISNLSYYPIFVENGLGRRVAIFVWIILAISLMVRPVNIGSDASFRRFFVLYIVFCINTLIVGTVNGVNAFDNHFFQPITIATIIFFLSNALGYEVDRNDLKKICIVYYYSMVIIAILLFIFYLRGTDLSYAIYGYRFGKNEIAVLLLCGLIICNTIYHPEGLLGRTIKIISILFFIGDVILLRTRSVMLGILFFILFVIFSKKNVRKETKIIFAIAIIATVFYFYVHPLQYTFFVDNIVFAGRDSNSLNSIASGRGDQIARGIEVFRSNILFGVGKRGTIDCFFISILANYGILCWPAVIMSLMPFIWSIQNLRKGDELDFCFFAIAAAMFILSILEELAPFGSGTRCYILWLMWGILINMNSSSADNIFMVNNPQKSKYIK